MRTLVFFLIMAVGMATVSFAQIASPEASTTAAKTIFDYQKDIGLSDKQVADMKALMSGLQNTLAEKAKEMKAMRQSLADMIKARKDMRSIRKQLEKIAALQVDNSYLDIETSRKVEDVLTKAQWTKWKDIQAKAVEAAVAKVKAAQEAKAAAEAKK